MDSNAYLQLSTAYRSLSRYIPTKGILRDGVHLPSEIQFQVPTEGTLFHPWGVNKWLIQTSFYIAWTWFIYIFLLKKINQRVDLKYKSKFRLLIFFSFIIKEYTCNSCWTENFFSFLSMLISFITNYSLNSTSYYHMSTMSNRAWSHCHVKSCSF